MQFGINYKIDSFFLQNFTILNERMSVLNRNNKALKVRPVPEYAGTG